MYELLTQEYEFAKIQEAKEIPTVNVLDPALLPERKSSPPRIIITVLGAMLSLVFGAVFVIGSAAWKQNESPEKELANEIWAELKARESMHHPILRRFWTKIGARNGSGGKAT